MAIFGIGGLGHRAQLHGGETVAVDVTDGKLALATDLGATHTVNAAAVDPVEAITALGGVDVAVVLAASPTVIEQAHRCLRRGGRLVLVSLPKDNAITLPVFETVLKGIRVLGSIVGTRADLAEVFRLHAAGRTRVVLQTRKAAPAGRAAATMAAWR
ncbi:zinc-binding dehydrogenase [Micromonospora sp. NPDC047707]|uniref:zinc-binding dehydrogenase n=1 Tax=Micromonospora sp. NPDC047707 TaxID=3154498 RepID=UPI0034571D74